MNSLCFYRLGRKTERKKTFWSQNAIKSLDSLGFSGLGRVIGNKDLFFLALSYGCQGDTEKYLTRENLYHPRHTCITRDVVEGNTGVSRVIQVFKGQIISLYHPGNHVIMTLSHRRNQRLLQNFIETAMKPGLREC